MFYTHLWDTCFSCQINQLVKSAKPWLGVYLLKVKKAALANKHLNFILP